MEAVMIRKSDVGIANMEGDRLEKLALVVTERDIMLMIMDIVRHVMSVVEKELSLPMNTAHTVMVEDLSNVRNVVVLDKFDRTKNSKHKLPGVHHALPLAFILTLYALSGRKALQVCRVLRHLQHLVARRDGGEAGKRVPKAFFCLRKLFPASRREIPDQVGNDWKDGRE